MRSAIDWATVSLAFSATELGIPSTNTDHPQTTPFITPTTPNTVAVVVANEDDNDDDDASSHLLVRSVCKHNQRQQRQRSHSSSRELYAAAPTSFCHRQVHQRLGTTGDTKSKAKAKAKEDEEEEHRKNKVANETGIQLQLRVSTPKPDTQSNYKQPSSSHSSHSDKDEFIQPDLIRFDDDDDEPLSPTLHITAENPLSTDDSESDEVSHLFPDNHKQSKPSRRPLPPLPPPSPPSHQEDLTSNPGNLLFGDLHTECEFDVRHLSEYSAQLGRVFECYDELIDSSDSSDDTSSTNTSSADEDTADEDPNSDSNQSCDCSLEAVPLLLVRTASSTPIPPNDHPTHHSSNSLASIYDIEMRESGTLRGLLKKPNRPPPTHKNRVIFDETQNKFFDADYIILIREDCPYDEEDEEPCTCGEHELVRLCCEEGCQCQAYSGAADGAVDNTRTPQVRVSAGVRGERRERERECARREEGGLDCNRRFII